MKPFEPAATVARQPRDRALCGVRSGDSGEGGSRGYRRSDLGL